MTDKGIPDFLCLSVELIISADEVAEVGGLQGGPDRQVGAVASLSLTYCVRHNMQPQLLA